MMRAARTGTVTLNNSVPSLTLWSEGGWRRKAENLNEDRRRRQCDERLVVSLCAGIRDWSDQIIILRKLEFPEPEGLSLGFLFLRFYRYFIFYIDKLCSYKSPSKARESRVIFSEEMKRVDILQILLPLLSCCLKRGAAKLVLECSSRLLT